MENRWSDRDAEAMVAHYAADGVSRDLARRVYTSRLLGTDARLVLHGGGNTSVKTTAKDLLGDDVEVLCVKGSGWDLGDIEPPGLPAVLLAPIRRLLALEALLKGPGIRVHQAESAEQALELLLRHEFALAILDVQMPGMDGFQLAELMRGTERTKQIPIVFVSAAGRELDYAFKGYESGAVDFMQKPLDTHAVRSKVSVFVDLYRNRKRLARQLEELERSRREQEVLLDELRSTKAELENAVRMRDDFMSIVSHELKTPLNTLILEVQLRKLQLRGVQRGQAAADGRQG